MLSGNLAGIRKYNRRSADSSGKNVTPSCYLSRKSPLQDPTSDGRDAPPDHRGADDATPRCARARDWRGPRRALVRRAPRADARKTPSRSRGCRGSPRSPSSPRRATSAATGEVVFSPARGSRITAEKHEVVAALGAPARACRRTPPVSFAAFCFEF